MNLNAVRELDAILQARGEPISANKIVEHLGGSKRDALRLLRLYRAETHEPSPTPAAPAAVLEPAGAAGTTASLAPVPAAAPPPVPTPLLDQATADRDAALMAEKRAKRDLDFASRGELERLQQVYREARRTRELAETRTQQLTRSRDTRVAAIPGLRIAARRAAGDLQAAQEQARRMLLKAQREADMAQEELDRLVQDLTQIAGEGAVPVEGA
jgi:hypothetical protein